MSSTPNSEQLARLREFVTSDPEIMRGTPVFKGTRIPADLVADMLAQGATAEEILEGYPTLNQEMISVTPWYTHVSGLQPKIQPPPWHGKNVKAGIRKGARTKLPSIKID